MGSEEEGCNEPCDPAILELCFEPRHAVTEIGRQFSEGNREREKKTQYERPCWQWTEQHVGGDHGVAKDRDGEWVSHHCCDGQTDNAKANEPEQVGFPCCA